MNTITLGTHNFSEYISEVEIATAVQDLANKINQNYNSDDPPIVMALLNGAFIFAADLCRKFDFVCDIKLLRVQSYDGLHSTGKVKIDHHSEPDMQGRRVLIIEDIVDTGNTLAAYLPTLSSKGASSVEVCSLLIKPNALQHDINVKYIGIEIPNDFVVGYGLDYNDQGRNLPAIYKIIEEN